MVNALKIEEEDMVAILLEAIKKDEECLVNDEVNLTVNDDIPFGHKVALEDIPAGKDIIKYGEVIGYATGDIKKGDWVHTHNIKSDRGRLEKGVTGR